MTVNEHPIFRLVGKRIQGVRASGLSGCEVGSVVIDFTDGSSLALEGLNEPTHGGVIPFQVNATIAEPPK